MQVALKVDQFSGLDTTKVNNDVNRSRRSDNFLRYILPQIEGTLGEDDSRKSSFTVFMTTQSCTSTSQMTTRNVRAMCPNWKKNNNEHLPVDCQEVSSSSAPE